MANRPGVIVYFDDLRPAMKLLKIEQVGALFIAMLDYAESGLAPDFKGDAIVQMVFEMLRPKIDRDNERYGETVTQKQYAVYCREARRNGHEPLSFDEWKHHPISPDNRHNHPYPTATPTAKAAAAGTPTATLLGTGTGAGESGRGRERENNGPPAFDDSDFEQRKAEAKRLVMYGYEQSQMKRAAFQQLPSVVTSQFILPRGRPGGNGKQ